MNNANIQQLELLNVGVAPAPDFKMVYLEALPPDGALAPLVFPPNIENNVYVMGVQVPIQLAYTDTPDTYVVLDGNRRIKAARRAAQIAASRGDTARISAFEAIPALIYPVGTVGAQDIVLSAHMRVDNLAVEVQAIYIQLGAGKPAAEIEMMVGKTRYKKLAKFLALHPLLLEAFFSGGMTPAAATAALKLTLREQMEYLLPVLARDGAVSADAVKAVRSLKSAEAIEAATAQLGLGDDWAEDDFALPLPDGGRGYIKADEAATALGQVVQAYGNNPGWRPNRKVLSESAFTAFVLAKLIDKAIPEFWPAMNSTTAALMVAAELLAAVGLADEANMIRPTPVGHRDNPQWLPSDGDYLEPTGRIDEGPEMDYGPDGEDYGAY